MVLLWDREKHAPTTLAPQKKARIVESPLGERHEGLFGESRAEEVETRKPVSKT